MFWVSLIFFKCGQMCELTTLASTASYCVFLGRTGNTWQKSPPKSTILPPKSLVEPQISYNIVFNASMLCLCAIEASSHISKVASLRSCARLDCLPTKQEPNASSSTGSLNREWAVRPVGKFAAATPELAVGRTILPSCRSLVYNAQYRKVFPVSPGPSMKMLQVCCASHET